MRKFCEECSPSLVLVNSLPCCKGQFTCVRPYKGDVSRTTIDYCAVASYDEHRVKSLLLVADSGLESDHYPLMLDLRWKPARAGVVRPRKCRLLYRVNEMNRHSWNRYKLLCDEEMIEWTL